MTRVLLCILLGLVVGGVACTSSSQTNIASGSRNYDSEYRTETRGAQSTGTTTEVEETPTGDPAITIMLMSMETGDVHPGDDYFVYAVVDNPDERNLEYVWSVANGSIAEVPESERGRMAALVETEYNTASATPAPAAVPAEQAPVEPGDEAPVPAEQPVQEQPGQPVPVPEVTAPPEAGLPGTEPVETEPFTETPSPTPSGGGSAYSPPAEAEVPPTVEEAGGSSESDIEIARTNRQEKQEELAQEQASENPNQDLIEYLIIEIEKYDKIINGALTADYMLGSVTERRMVSGEEVDSENVEALAAQLAASVTASSPEASETRAEPTGAAVAVEESAASDAAWIGDEPKGLAPGRGKGIRYEYEVWKDDSEEPRRRQLGGYGSLEESEALSWEDSSEVYTFETDEPYILWTPRIPGQVNIHLQVNYKGEQVAGPAPLNVEVRLRDPMVELSEEFPDILREDEHFYVALNATNIPAFYKGLFTLTFDSNILSFRDAELGEFFDDAPAATLFYAEPDKLAGKVLLAADSNRELFELGGEGVVLYVKFKAKQDITSREQTKLALVMDTTARYILDFNGENVLPLPVARTAYRTDTIMPPDLNEYNRKQTPGTQAGQAATSQPTQPQASQQAVQQGGSGVFTPSTQTETSYVPPATTPATGVGTVYSSDTGSTPAASTGGQSDTGAAAGGNDGAVMDVNRSALSTEEEEEQAGNAEENAADGETADTAGTETPEAGAETGTEPEGEGTDATETGETSEPEPEGAADPEPETDPEPEPEPAGEDSGE